MIIDKKGKLFGKINIIDIAVVLIIVTAVCVTYFKFNKSAHSDVSETNSHIEYVVKAKAVRDFSVNAVEKGDKVYDTENDVYLGTVKSTRTEQAKEFLTKSNGEIVYCDLPDKYNLYITIEADARVNNSGVYVDGTKPIINNSNITIGTKRVKMKTEVTQINK